MKKFASFLVLSFCFYLTVHAQVSSTIQFEAEFSSKLSVGKEVMEGVLYEPGFTINYPKSSRYQNPAYSLEVSSLFPVTKSIRAGISAGVVWVINDRKPLGVYDYFNRVLIPIVGRLQYSFKLPSDIELSPEGRFGYQFTQSNFDPVEDSYIYTQTGGITSGCKVSVSKKMGDYYPFFSIAYEMNKLANDVSLGWIDGYDYQDRYQFSTTYHLLNLGVGVRM